MKSELTVVYKLKGKLNIGVVGNDSEITHFVNLRVINDTEFGDNAMYVMMTSVGSDGYLDIVEVHEKRYKFSNIEDDAEYIALANSTLSEFKRTVKYH